MTIKMGRGKGLIGKGLYEVLKGMRDSCGGSNLTFGMKGITCIELLRVLLYDVLRIGFLTRGESL